MAKIPEDIKAGIEALSKKKDVPIKDLLAKLKEIIEEDENLKAMENDNFKIRVAWAALYKEYSSSQGQECLISPLLHCNTRYIRIKDENTAIGDISALVKPLKNEKGEEIEYNSPDEGWQYAAGTLWRDAAKNIKDLEVGKVYQTTVILSTTYSPGKDRKRKERDWGLGIIANNATFKPTKEKAPDFKKFYEDNIEDNKEMMDLCDADVNESAHDTDIRIVRIQIMDEDFGEREDGSEYAYYDIMDNTIAGETRRFFIDKRDYKYMQGSVLLAGITVVNTAKDEEEPKFRLNPQWFIPEIAEEISFEEPQSVDTEEIILDEPEEKKEEKEEKPHEGESKKEEEGDLFEI